MANLAPAIGDWFLDRSQHQLFEVVALDEHSGTIEVQFVDGEVGEFDTENWRLLSVESAAPPEDWSAGYEMTTEDIGDEEYPSSHVIDPLSMLEAEVFEDFDDF
jgi:Family of unknown function (DUF6763)